MFRGNRRIEEIDDIAGANPAVGVEWTLPVPVGETWEILTIKATLVASAAAANRSPRIRVDGPVISQVALLPSGRIQIASETVIYQWGVGLGFANDGAGAQAAPLPARLLVTYGMTLQSVTVNLQAGDDWSNPTLYVRRLFEHPRFF